MIFVIPEKRSKTFVMVLKKFNLFTTLSLVESVPAARATVRRRMRTETTGWKIILDIPEKTCTGNHKIIGIEWSQD